jgi:hypothetical protein
MKATETEAEAEAEARVGVAWDYVTLGYCRYKRTRNPSTLMRREDKRLKLLY